MVHPNKFLDYRTENNKFPYGKRTIPVRKMIVFCTGIDFYIGTKGF